MIPCELAAVTFDATGTLIHAPRLGEIYAEVLGRHGMRVEPGAAERTVRRVWVEMACAVELGRDRFRSHPEGARGWWARFLERVCEHLDLGRPSRFACAELFDQFGRAEAWDVYPEVAETLQRLHDRGLRLAVVSNWDERLPGLLERLELARFLDVVVYSAEVGSEKPFPAIFRLALDRLGVPPSLALHVGDRPAEDVEGAVAVGMHALHLDRLGGGGDLRDLRPLVDLCLPAGRATGVGR